MRKGRTGNFTPAEDQHLSQNWIEVLTDPLTNNLQKKDQFWERITSNFNKYSGSGREAKSLSNRYASFLISEYGTEDWSKYFTFL